MSLNLDGLSLRGNQHFAAIIEDNELEPKNSPLSHHIVSVSMSSFPELQRVEISSIEQIWDAAQLGLRIIFLGAFAYSLISYAIVPLVLTNLSNFLIYSIAVKEIFQFANDWHYPFVNIQAINSEQPAPRPFPVQATALEDSAQSFEAKKRLIERAEKSIILSGNYCGGLAFQQILEAIQENLRRNPELKVIILSSRLFVTEENFTLLHELEDAYAHFHFIQTDKHLCHTTGGLKVVDNHIKGLVVDGYDTIIGGDGIEDRYMVSDGTGQSLRRYQFGDIPPVPHIQGSSARLANLILPEAFRDFSHFISGAEFGRHTASQLLNFAQYWLSVHASKPENNKPISFGIDDCIPDEVQFAPGVEPVPTAEFYACGPELRENHFLERVIELIDRTEQNNRIYIDHMYFQPTKEFRNSLVQAAARGAKVLIVTNGYDPEYSPKTHATFADLNRMKYIELIERVPEYARANVEVYEYGQPFKGTPKNTTLHKKVMVIETPDDRYVAFGNGNIGYKTQITQSDYEIEVILTGDRIAQQNITLIEEDAFAKKCFIYAEDDEDQESPLLGLDQQPIEMPLSVPIYKDGNWVQRGYLEDEPSPPPVNYPRYAFHYMLRPLTG